jgi:hypothetical protein
MMTLTLDERAAADATPSQVVVTGRRPANDDTLTIDHRSPVHEHARNGRIGAITYVVSLVLSGDGGATPPSQCRGPIVAKALATRRLAIRACCTSLASAGDPP